MCIGPGGLERKSRMQTDGFTADRTAVSVNRSKLTMTDACPSPMAVGYARKDHAVTSADVSANASVCVGM